MSNTTSSSHSSHHVQHFSPHVHPHHHQPAQLSSREKLVSPNPEDHTAPKHQTIIRPQDVNTQLTSGLAALVQETSPLALLQNAMFCKKKSKTSIQQHALKLFIKIDSFQDPKSDLYGKTSEIDSFQYPYILDSISRPLHFGLLSRPLCLDSFQDPYV